MRHHLCFVPLLWACSSGTDDTSTLQCGSMAAFVSGTVTDASGNPVPNPVVAANLGSEAVASSDWSDASGAYELNLESAGTWVLVASAPDNSCLSETTDLTVVACEEYVVNFTCD